MSPWYIFATGGEGQLNDRVEVLDGRTIIAFPDVDGYETWKEKAEERPYLNIHVSDILEKTATEEDRASGIDIADVLIRWKQGRPTYVAPKPQSQRLDNIQSTNPVFWRCRSTFPFSTGEKSMP